MLSHDRLVVTGKNKQLDDTSILLPSRLHCLDPDKTKYVASIDGPVLAVLVLGSDDMWPKLAPDAGAPPPRKPVKKATLSEQGDLPNMLYIMLKGKDDEYSWGTGVGKN